MKVKSNFQFCCMRPHFERYISLNPHKNLDSFTLVWIDDDDDITNLSCDILHQMDYNNEHFSDCTYLVFYVIGEGTGP